eukprot:5073586-Prymnesium_polylepis.1
MHDAKLSQRRHVWLAQSLNHRGEAGLTHIVPLDAQPGERSVCTQGFGQRERGAVDQVAAIQIGSLDARVVREQA